MEINERIRLYGIEYKKTFCGRQNKKGLIAKAIFACLFAFMMMLSNMVLFGGSIFGNFEDNCFVPFKVGYLAIFLLYFLLSYAVVCLFEWLLGKAENHSITANRNYKKYYFWIFTGVLLLCWLPYYLSYFPGGVFADTFRSISQATGKEVVTNNHPILYMLVIKLFIGIGGLLGQGLQFSIGLFTLAQCVAMALVLAYFLYWMYKHNVAWVYIALSGAFFCFFPLIPYYAIAVWKDTPFSLALFLFAIYVLDISLSDGKVLFTWKGAVKYCILGLLVTFLRNNTLPLVLIITLILFIAYRKKLCGPLKKFMLLSIGTVVTISGIQGPLYDKLGYNEIKTVESYGPMLQHIAYVVSTEGDVSEDQVQFLYHIIPLDKMKEMYAPCIVNQIKWDPSFDNEYLNEHKDEFIRVWASIAMRNPGSVVKAQLLETLGFWDITRGKSTGYIQKDVWFEGQGLVSIDYFEKVFGFSFDEFVSPKHYISAALFAWLALCNATIVVSQKKYRFLWVFLIPLFMWAGTLIGTPIAFSLRYIYICVLFIPMGFLLSILPYPQRKKTEAETNRA